MKQILFLVGVIACSMQLWAQIPAYPPAPAPPGNVVKAEYFVDIDPGFGLGTNIPLTAALNLPALVASVNTTFLTAGVHRLYVRSLNAEGKWSVTNSRLFAVESNYPAAPAASGNITKAEYYFDTDPGFGLGTNIPLTAASNLPALLATMNTASLNPGIHRLYIRSKNASGKWSITSSRLFAVEPNYPAAPAIAGNINKAEYYIDTDPGFGLGTNIPLTAATNLPALIASINTASIPAGIHRIYVRSKNVEGKWSITSSSLFAVTPQYPSSPAVAGNITKAEFYIDNDPGFGQATSIPLTAASNIPALLATINTTTTPPGIHRLCIRAQNNVGKWSITSTTLFGVSPDYPYPAAPPPAGNITKAEYYIDTDPGFGLGTNVPLTAAVDLPSLVASVNTGALAPGVHRLYLRSKGTEGKWSITSSRLFASSPNYPTAPAAPSNITKAEYYIDSDPGFGLGTNITLTAAANIPALLASINTSAINPGIHRLYVRARSSTGRWSVTSSMLFAKYNLYPGAPTPAGNITRIEYFFDVDPGFGNGVSVPISAAVNINNLTFPVNTSTLLPGTHRLYIRSKDDWSVTSVRSFVVNPAALPLELLSFDGKKVDQHVDLNWETTNEVNTAYFDVERSPNGVEFEAIGQVEAVNRPGNHQYLHQDMKPLNGLNYYRLKQVDQDGKSTYTKVISVLFSSYGEGGVIYPNPATSYVNIQTGYDGTREVAIQVYDMNGRMVMHQTETKSSLIRLDIGALAPGNYTIQCSDGREIFSGRFTKE